MQRFFVKDGRLALSHDGTDEEVNEIIGSGMVECDGPPPTSNHRWDGAKWVLDLTTVREEKHAAINADCEKAIASIQASYPASEVLSWPKQEAEARSYVADPDAVTPLLDALAEARGIDKAELARRVILKADAFAQYSGAAIGKRQALEDALNALPADATAEQIAAIAW